MILALDLGSTITGWAIGDLATRSIVDSGAWQIKGSRFDDYGVRALRLQQNLAEIRKLYPIREVVFERVEFRGANSSVNEPQLYGLTYAAMALWCKQNLLRFYGVTTGEWKKRVTGAGNASKAMVADAVKMLTGKTVEQQDEADALAILLWRLHTKII